jgi:hypothetical protein
MFPSCHIFGTIPISFGTLNIIVSGSVITLVNSVKAFGSKPKTKSGIGELKTTNSNGEVETAKTDKEKAEVLANFYSSVFTREHGGDIPQLETCMLYFLNTTHTS